MGEVYRAHDTKLGRDVAVKILPVSFALDADRLARFEREARLLASLNHANIAAIYGIEDAGDVRALVLELVDGQTLAEKLSREALPLPEALAFARQICDALEAAHERGIVHRDLKPANIAITRDGTVKVLDFGLAKDGAGGAGQAGAGRKRPDAFADDDGADRARCAARHGAVHEPRTGARENGRQADRHLGVRLRALRNADRAPRVSRRDDVGCGRRHPRARAGLVRALRHDARECPAAARALSHQGSKTAAARHRRRARRARRAAARGRCCRHCDRVAGDVERRSIWLRLRASPSSRPAAARAGAFGATHAARSRPRKRAASANHRLHRSGRARRRSRRTGRPWRSSRRSVESVRSGSDCWQAGRRCRSLAIRSITISRDGRPTRARSSITRRLRRRARKGAHLGDLSAGRRPATACSGAQRR